MCEQLIRSLRFLATAEDATGMADSALAMREAAAELERLRKDAERYHYIRKMELREAGFKENTILFAAQDEAIDAAIAAEGGGK